MSDQTTIHISGKENGSRIESRVLEEQIQKAVADGYRRIKIEALGQHGIGGRLLKRATIRLPSESAVIPVSESGPWGFPTQILRFWDRLPMMSDG